jgi:hypothetical protein
MDPLRQLRLLAPLTVLLVAGIPAAGGCARTDYLVRSDHYTVVVPKSWRVVQKGGEVNLPTILRVPSPTISPSDVSEDKLELRVYPWLERSPIQMTTEEAVKRLAAAGELELQSAVPVRADDCASAELHLLLFGTRHAAIRLRTISGRLLVIAASQGGGSLVAIVGVMDKPPSCLNIETTEDAMKTLAAALTENGGSRPPRNPPVRLDSMFRPPIELAAPEPPAP